MESIYWYRKPIMINKANLIKNLPEIFLLVLAFIVVFFQLGQSSLEDWDEAIYAQVAKEMVNNGDWLTMHYGNELWFEKPPLLIWITAFFFSIFEVNEFWARSASAISAVLLILITWRIAKLLYDPKVGAIAILILLTGYGFLYIARSGTTDTLLTFSFYLGIYAYLRVNYNHSEKWWYVFWLSFSLGFMTKFWAIAILPICVAITLFLKQNILLTVRSRHFWIGLLVSILIIAPWHVKMIITYGIDFIERYLLYDLVKRSTSAIEGNMGGIFFYIRLMPRMFFPWFFLAPFAFIFSFLDNLKHRMKNPILLVIVLLVFGIYSLLVQTKIFHYITPVFPALAIMMGILITRSFQYQNTLLLTGLILATLTTASVAIITEFVPHRLHISLFMLVLIFTISVYLLQRFIYQSTIVTKIKNKLTIHKRVKFEWMTGPKDPSQISMVRLYLVLFLCLYMTSLGVNRSWQRYDNVTSPIAELATIAGQNKDTSSKRLLGLAFEGYYDAAVWGPTAMFYSDRITHIAEDFDDLENLVQGQGSEEIILANELVYPLSLKYKFYELKSVFPYVYGIIQDK
jgi:4-amino-4-deoxy-L-arabinose transferase-like glycosyltransferase